MVASITWGTQPLPQQPQRNSRMFANGAAPGLNGAWTAVQPDSATLQPVPLERRFRAEEVLGEMTPLVSRPSEVALAMGLRGATPLPAVPDEVAAEGVPAVLARNRRDRGSIVLASVPPLESTTSPPVGPCLIRAAVPLALWTRMGEEVLVQYRSRRKPDCGNNSPQNAHVVMDGR